MSIWMIIVGATAFGGALLVWNAVSHVKHNSESVLDKYRELLEHARADKAARMAEQTAEAAGTDAPADGVEPVEVS